MLYLHSWTEINRKRKTVQCSKRYKVRLNHFYHLKSINFRRYDVRHWKLQNMRHSVLKWSDKYSEKYFNVMWKEKQGHEVSCILQLHEIIMGKSYEEANRNSGYPYSGKYIMGEGPLYLFIHLINLNRPRRHFSTFCHIYLPTNQRISYYSSVSVQKLIIPFGSWLKNSLQPLEWTDHTLLL